MNESIFSTYTAAPSDDKGSFAAEVDESRREWPAWLLSVVLHATILIACGLLAPIAANPPPGERQRAVGIALVQRPLGDVTSVAGTTVAAAARLGHSAADGLESPDREFLSKLPTFDAIPSEIGAALPQAGGMGSIGVELGLPNATGFATGVSGGAGKGAMPGQTNTQVFGAGGTGSKFLYVFDRSASMGGFEGRPLAAAKSELLKSLDDLRDNHQFQIAFYNERLHVFNPAAPARATILFATEENRTLARDFVQRISPMGGTRHREALELALAMSPDVIFFLTDADEPQLSPGELADLRRRNRGSIIHCIEFGVGPFSGYDNFLVRLARQNRGQHVYVDVTSLRRIP